MANTAMTSTRPLNVTVGGGLGAAFLLVGATGFLVTGGLDFLARDGKALLLFHVNPFHNVVHLLVGLLLLAGAMRGLATARAVNLLVGGIYLLVGVLGLFVLDTDLDILALNGADNILHLGSALVLLAVGLKGDRAISARR